MHKPPKIKIFVPAAGFGTRVGSPPAKEMLFLKSNNEMILKERLIDQIFILQKMLDAEVIVITREDKIELIDYLKNKKDISTLIIKASKEWPETLLKVADSFGQQNLLYLPDTRFQPIAIVVKMLEELEHFPLVLAAFSPPDLDKFGCFLINNQNHRLFEKPAADYIQKHAHQLMAWGLLAFRGEIGLELFEKLLSSTLNKREEICSFTFKYHLLDEFKDLSRDGRDLHF